MSTSIDQTRSLIGVTRRTFLVSSALTTGGLLLGAVFRPKLALGETSKHRAEPIALNAWLRIGFDDTVTIIVSQAEMGQGITTTLPAVVAEELGADWNRVKLRNSPADPAYRNPARNWQFTVNIDTTTAFFHLFLTLCSAAKETLTSPR